MSQSLEVLKALTQELNTKDIEDRIELEQLRLVLAECYRNDCPVVRKALEEGRLLYSYLEKYVILDKI